MLAFVLMSIPGRPLPGIPAWAICSLLLIGLALSAPRELRHPRSRLVLVAALLALGLSATGSAADVYDYCKDPSLPDWLWWAAGCWMP